MKVFGNQGSASSREECDEQRGGPTYANGGENSYGRQLANWLRYPDLKPDGTPDAVKGGRHCFQVDPCPHQQYIVPHDKEHKNSPYQPKRVWTGGALDAAGDYETGWVSQADMELWEAKYKEAHSSAVAPGLPPGVGEFKTESDGTTKKKGKLVSFHEVYPFVTCPGPDANGVAQPCNAGYYLNDQGEAQGAYSAAGETRAYNPPREIDTYCESVV